MRNMIEIRPTPEQLRPFAVWAVAQTPKLRTIGTNLFAVPADLFADIPEDLLIGSRVDGHRYVSPDEDAALGLPAPGDLLGVATPEGLELREGGTPAGWLPDAPVEAYEPDSVPLPLPAGDDTTAGTEVPDGVFPCSGCEREFTSERGRDTHQRMKHAEA